MQVIVRYFTMFLAGVWMLCSGVPSAVAAADLCPMGGVMIKAAIVKDKALAWAASPRAAAISGAETDNWYLFTRSVTDQDIGIMIAPGFVFFGVAGRGGEVYLGNIEKAFGKDFGKLKEAVGKTLADLVAAGAVKLETADITAIAGAAGLGVLEKGAGGWALTTRNCQAVDLPTSGL